jgi:hypothetical protein
MSFERARRSSQSCGACVCVCVCVCVRGVRGRGGGMATPPASAARSTCGCAACRKRMGVGSSRAPMSGPRASVSALQQAGRRARVCCTANHGPCRGLPFRRGRGCRGCKSATVHRKCRTGCTGRGWRHHLSGTRAPSLVDRHRPMPSRAHDLSMHRPRAPAVHTRSRRTPPPLAHRRARVQHCSVFAVVQSAIGRSRRRRRCGCACLRMRACVPPPRGGLNRNARRCCSLDPRARTRAHQHRCTCKVAVAKMAFRSA